MATATASTRDAQLALLKKLCRVTPTMRSFGPKSKGLEIGTYVDYPAPGLRTHVTFGASQVGWSMWRGLSLSRELTMTLDATSDTRELVELLEAAVLEDHRIVATKERRSFLEYNGVWAPGYPPHLFFSTSFTATPDLMVQKKLGDRYVQFLSAVPIDDRELRAYERSTPDTGLALEIDDAAIATYPRPAR
jgi:hypothetical protein